MKEYSSYTTADFLNDDLFLFWYYSGEGDYYRIASYAQNHLYDCWAVSAKDKSEVLVTYVQVLAEPNSRSKKLYLRGFDESTFYKLEETDEIYSGENLQKCGFLMKRMKGDFVSRLFHFIKIAK